MSWSRRELAFAALVLICLGALLAWEVKTAPPLVVDDAYITFSFSRSLAEGRGPVYGHGMRVEGYSNFLWMVLVAGPLFVARHADPILVARLLCIPFALLLLAGTYGLVRRHASAPYAVAAALFVAVDVDVVLACLCGIETLAYVALVTFGFFAYLLAPTPESAPVSRLPLYVMTGAALTRIDGFVPLGYLIGFEVASAIADRRFSLRVLARWLWPPVAIWALWFVWRWRYYGMPLPATYYAKALIPVLLPNRGVEYVLDELATSGVYVGVVAAALLLWLRRRHALLLLGFSVIQLWIAAHVGGDWMPTGRFVLPAVPLLVVLLAWGLQEAATLARERGRFAHAAVAIASVATLAVMGHRVEHHVSSVAHTRWKLALSVEQVGHVATLKEAATLLARVVPPGGRLVTDYGGVLAYYTESDPIEMWGLANAAIATRGGTEGINPIYGRTCPQCYPELRPEYFHIEKPFLRPLNAFHSQADVVRAVWQSRAIGRYIRFADEFVAGRIVDLRRRKALWFLQRKSPGWTPPPPGMAGRFRVEYPFP